MKPPSHGSFARAAVKALLMYAAVASSTAYAEFRLATVDVNRILNESKDAIAKRKELLEISEKAKHKIEAKRKPLIRHFPRHASVTESETQPGRIRDLPPAPTQARMLAGVPTWTNLSSQDFSQAASRRQSSERLR